jgi:hypothetical protein
MQLYLVKVIDSVLPRKRNAKVFLQSYVTVATSSVNAAQNVVRENTVHLHDRIIVAPINDLTVGLGSRSYYPRDIDRLVGEQFAASDLHEPTAISVWDGGGRRTSNLLHE